MGFFEYATIVIMVASGLTIMVYQLCYKDKSCGNVSQNHPGGK